jgi:hypothetical protein
MAVRRFARFDFKYDLHLKSNLLDIISGFGIVDLVVVVETES